MNANASVETWETASEGIALTGDESRLDPHIYNDPFPFYKALRSDKPVYYDAKTDVYFVSRHEDAMTVLRDDDTFSVEHGYQDRWANGFVDELAEIMERDGGGFIRDPMFDPPVHTRHRRLVEKAFTAHRVKSLEPRMREIAVELLTPLAERGYGDGMLDIGAPLTAMIICEQLGFNHEEVGVKRLGDWTHALFAQMGRMQTHDELIENARLICDMQNYIMPLIEERQREPREDMLSDLVHARLEDEDNPELSMQEKVGWVRAFLTAGNDTTATAIANILLALAKYPGLSDYLYENIDDERIYNRFVEELLRIMPPVHGLFRCTTRDTELAGVQIPEDAHICILFASANRDDSVFASPERLTVDRENVGRHLSFGAGIHRCVGAALSRMEIKVAAQEIVRALDNIQLAISPDEITYVSNLAMQTMESLPLTFTRRA